MSIDIGVSGLIVETRVDKGSLNALARTNPGLVFAFKPLRFVPIDEDADDEESEDRSAMAKEMQVVRSSWLSVVVVVGRRGCSTKPGDVYDASCREKRGRIGPKGLY